MRRTKTFPLFFAIIILISVTYGAFTISSAISERNRKLLEVSAKEQKVIELKKSIAELENEISESDSMKYVEKVAREDLGMVKPREVVYVDKDKEDNNL
ncbi:FtsB family cell division protein [Peptoniphilus catoniae]|uniref:FtsB family cell division protein n=1 Tax=Peptoniphilus catoniae TaxID=1660341 RepID=UPI001FECEF4F|nr:septum formation initiator family protein [Peptoniphilus catoniae]